MDSLLWLLAFAAMTMFMMRWLLAGNATPLNRRAVRNHFIQHLFTACPDVQILAETEDELAVQIGEQRCDIHLDQLYRRCVETPAHIAELLTQAVNAVTHAFTETNALPEDWERCVIPLLLRQDSPRPVGMVCRALIDSLLIGYAVMNTASFRWITRQEIEDAGVSEDRLHEVALRNLERSCNALVIETPGAQDDGRERLIRFLTADGLDAARVLLPSFFQRFSPRFADADLIVAIPARDALAMTAVTDQSLTNFIAWQSSHAHARQPYPLVDQLFIVSEQGIAPWPPTPEATRQAVQ